MEARSIGADKTEELVPRNPQGYIFAGDNSPNRRVRFCVHRGSLVTLGSLEELRAGVEVRAAVLPEAERPNGAPREKEKLTS